MQPAPSPSHVVPGGSAKQLGVPLHVQHDAALPQVAAPHTLPGFFWQVPFTTQV